MHIIIETIFKHNRKYIQFNDPAFNGILQIYRRKKHYFANDAAAYYKPTLTF